MIWYLVYAECYITSRLEYCCCCSHPPVLVPMSKMVHWECTLPPGTQRYRPVGTIGVLTSPVRAMLQLDGMMSLWRVTGSKRPLLRRAPTNHASSDDLLRFPPNLSHFRPTLSFLSFPATQLLSLPSCHFLPRLSLQTRHARLPPPLVCRPALDNPIKEVNYCLKLGDGALHAPTTNAFNSIDFSRLDNEAANCGELDFSKISPFCPRNILSVRQDPRNIRVAERTSTQMGPQKSHTSKGEGVMILEFGTRHAIRMSSTNLKRTAPSPCTTR